MTWKDWQFNGRKDRCEDFHLEVLNFLLGVIYLRSEALLLYKIFVHITLEPP